MASLSKSIAVKPFLMKTVSESHLIDDDASSQNGAGKQVPSSENKTKNIRHKGTKPKVITKKLITIQTSPEDSSAKVGVFNIRKVRKRKEKTEF